MSIDCDHRIREFKKEHGIQKIIAFSGGTSDEIDGIPKDDPIQEKYKIFINELQEKILGECIGLLRGYQIAVLTGGTKFGVPKTATEIAKKYGLKTIGVYPLIGKKHVLDSGFLDLDICIEPSFGESQWGDESPIFAQLLDGVVVYGGGAGTLIECAHILKMNENLKKKGIPMKYIVPISGTGGVADGLHFIWSKPEVRSMCIPQVLVLNGLEAAGILRKQLALNDFIIEEN